MYYLTIQRNFLPTILYLSFRNDDATVCISTQITRYFHGTGTVVTGYVRTRGVWPKFIKRFADLSKNLLITDPTFAVARCWKTTILAAPRVVVPVICFGFLVGSYLWILRRRPAARLTLCHKLLDGVVWISDDIIRLQALLTLFYYYITLYTAINALRHYNL